MDRVVLDTGVLVAAAVPARSGLRQHLFDLDVERIVTYYSEGSARRTLTDAAGRYKHWNEAQIRGQLERFDTLIVPRVRLVDDPTVLYPIADVDLDTEDLRVFHAAVLHAPACLLYIDEDFDHLQGRTILGVTVERAAVYLDRLGFRKKGFRGKPRTR